MIDEAEEHAPDDDAPVNEPRLWQGNGWTARVIKNDDDEGWAVAMIKDGEQVGKVRTSAGFKLSTSSAIKWIENDFRDPSPHHG